MKLNFTKTAAVAVLALMLAPSVVMASQLPYKQEDVPHASGDFGTPSLVVRKDTQASLAGTNGDYSLLQVDSNGSLRIVGNKLEDAPHSSADALLPIGGLAKSTRAGSSNADGDYVLPIISTDGALYVTQDTDSASVTTYTASVTATGSTDSGANVVHGLCATNGDGTNAHYLKIYDKATAATQADTPIMKIALKSVDTVCVAWAGGIPITNGISLRATTENADSGTTGADANDVSVTLRLKD